MTFIRFLYTILLAGLFLAAPHLQAWGPQGHRVIGQTAIGFLTPVAQTRLEEILAFSPSGDMANSMDFACNWPDEVRTQEGWKWSAPLHYVNIPRYSQHYERERDCPDGLCVTEGILRYANELTFPGLEPERRWQAFAFLCHLVADLHQPLHAGFRDDRGGNLVDIEYRGEAWNLHQFWDSVLIRERLGDEHAMVMELQDSGNGTPPDGWNPASVISWTDESHRIARDSAYPVQEPVSEPFAERSWIIIQQQFDNAAARLALILNTVLGEEENPDCGLGEAGP